MIKIDRDSFVPEIQVGHLYVTENNTMEQMWCIKRISDGEILIKGDAVECIYKDDKVFNGILMSFEIHQSFGVLLTIENEMGQMITGVSKIKKI